MAKNLVMVLDSKSEFDAAKETLEGPLETITRKSKIYNLRVDEITSEEAYGKTLDLIKDTARKLEYDAVHVRKVHYLVGFFSITTTISAELYRMK